MTEPVGPQYGLNPRLDHAEPEKVYTSRDVLTNTTRYDDPTATEYGGVAGLVQSTPHVPTGHERMRQIYAIDPADPGDGVAAPAELEGSFNTIGME